MTLRFVPDNDRTYGPTDDPNWWRAVEECDTDTCHHPVHAFAKPKRPMRHLERAEVIRDEGIEVPEGFVRPHDCGHFAVERGCGGCDPSAIEFVVEDGVLRPFDPPRDLSH